MRLISSLLAVLCAVATGPVAAADILVLKDGRVFDGVKLQKSDTGLAILFQNGEIPVDPEAVHEYVIEGGVPYEPQNDDEREKLAKGLVKYEGSWLPQARRDQLLRKRIEEQKSQLEEIKRVRVWRNRNLEETKNFAFESTVPPHIFASYRDLCETYFSEFCKEWRIKKPRGVDKLPLKFFVDQENFLQVTGVPRGVAGFFQFVFPPFELCIYYDRLDPRQTEEVLYHELGHYLHKLINPDFKYPHWPGESLSEYYGASSWDPVKKKLTTGLINEGRLAFIRSEISKGNWVNLKEMILGCQDRNFHDYSWGWSFVHMLLSDPKYSSKFQKFFIALANGRDVDRFRQQFTDRHQFETVDGPSMLAAFMKYMGIKSEEDLEALEKEWYAYVQDELVISSTRGIEDAAYLALRNDRPLAAKNLYAKAIEQGTTNAVTYYRYGEVLDHGGDEEGARKSWRKAIELDPLTSDFYVALGESLLGEKGEEEKAEGRRLIQLALEIEPDNYYLERNAKKLLKD